MAEIGTVSPSPAHDNAAEVSANIADGPYLDLLARCARGAAKDDRTGTGTWSVFGAQMRFDLSGGRLPLLTSKRVHWKSVAHELLWMLRGETNIGYLHDNGVTIWDEWADANGDLGPVYGAQWRAWTGPDGRSHDQIATIIDLLRRDPESRRLVVNAWAVHDLGAMALSPCHCLFQFNTRLGPEGGRYLDCQLYQRSADIFLGVPFNIASYALLTHIIARAVPEQALQPGEFIWTGGDVHLYRNHIEQARTQLARTEEALALPSPRLSVDPFPDIDSVTFDHLHLEDYRPMKAIPAPVAV